MFNYVLLGDCVHNVKVTYLKGLGWGIRVFVNGKLNQQSLVKDRREIGPEIKNMLRMEDKCGNMSDLASSSRERRRGNN